MALVTGPNGQTYSDFRAENAAYQAGQAKKTAAAPAPPRPIRPVVVRAPTREQYGTPSREGIDTTQADMSRFLTDYENPRNTNRFADQLGAASSSLARQEQERVRQAGEIASRRGYVGGFSGENDRAKRDFETDRARIGFDAANTISHESAGLYEGAAGRFSQLVQSYNDQLSAGDRAYGGAVEDSRNAYRQSVENFRAAQEQARQYDQNFGETQRQYDTGLGEKKREFDVGESGTNSRAEAERQQRERESARQDALDRDRLTAQQKEADAQHAIDVAKALGIDPRMVLGSGLSVPGLLRRATTPTAGGSAPAPGRGFISGTISAR